MPLIQNNNNANANANVNANSNEFDSSYVNRLRNQSQRVNNSRQLFDLVFNRVFSNFEEEQKQVIYFDIDSRIHNETCEEYNDKIYENGITCDYGIWADIITKKYDLWRLCLENRCVERL